MIENSINTLNKLKIHKDYNGLRWVVSLTLVFIGIILAAVMNTPDISDNNGTIIKVMLYTYSLLILPIGIIVIMYTLSVDKRNSNNIDINTLNSVMNTIRHIKDYPLIHIRLRYLNKLHIFDANDIIKYCENNYNQFLTQKNLYNNLKGILCKTQQDVDKLIDDLLYNDVVITRREHSMMLLILSEIQSKYELWSYLTFKVTYDSPAGCNHYEKLYKLNESMLSNLELILNRDDKKQQNKYTKKTTNEEYNRDYKDDLHKYTDKEIELEKALAMYMLDIPFSKSELKSQRNRLLKSFHPDSNNNGSSAYAIKINDAYELLQKYAVE